MPAQKYDITADLLEKFDLNSFFTQYKNVSIDDFILRNKTKFSIDKHLLAEQIKLNNKSVYKIPTFYAANCWLTSKSFEQASGEKSALYKASLFSGEKCLDLCGGLGVDDWAFSARFGKVISLDIDGDLNLLVNQNFRQLKLENTVRLTEDAYLFLKNTKETYDLIYMDADRRVNGKKGFRLDDIEPSYHRIESRLREITNKVLLKLSPLIDISYCVRNLKNLKCIHIVAQNGEVKEVLCDIEYTLKDNNSQIMAVDIRGENTQQFAGTIHNQAPLLLMESPHKKYFFEASSAIVKAGLNNVYGSSNNLISLYNHSPYFIGDTFLSNFMGRCFEIVATFEFSKKIFSDYLTQHEIYKANVSRSNFLLSPEEIKKQFRLKDGGDNYFFFTTLHNGKKMVFHTKK